MVAARRQELPYPMRLYAIPNLWRYERPQRGRLREHWQLNVDIFGVQGIEADHEIYFPALVGFGDENVFDKNLDLTLRSGITGDEIPTELLSIFDAVSFVLNAVKSKELPNRLWIQGSKIEKTSLEKGFKEITNQGALLNAIAPLSYYYQKMSGKIPQFKIHSVSKVPSQVTLANDFFPTTLSTWERFLRDSYRIYKTTPDSEILLHFRPTKSP
jgi:hypothetical protein